MKDDIEAISNLIETWHLDEASEIEARDRARKALSRIEAVLESSGDARELAENRRMREAMKKAILSEEFVSHVLGKPTMTQEILSAALADSPQAGSVEAGLSFDKPPIA